MTRATSSAIGLLLFVLLAPVRCSPNRSASAPRSPVRPHSASAEPRSTIQSPPGSANAATPSTPTTPTDASIASDEERVAAAKRFSSIYDRSRLHAWHVRGHAVGPHNEVLLVEISKILDVSLIEALHYGSGAYDVCEGGVQHFARSHAFRRVVYHDASKAVWEYELNGEAAAAVPPCQ
jgi:hypothetical protein